MLFAERISCTCASSSLLSSLFIHSGNVWSLYTPKALMSARTSLRELNASNTSYTLSSSVPQPYPPNAVLSLETRLLSSVLGTVRSFSTISSELICSCCFSGNYNFRTSIMFKLLRRTSRHNKKQYYYYKFPHKSTNLFNVFL